MMLFPKQFPDPALLISLRECGGWPGYAARYASLCCVATDVNSTSSNPVLASLLLMQIIPVL